MATVTITIETGNAAFEDGDEGTEVCRILRSAAARLNGLLNIADEAFPLMDINGNQVGSVVVS